MSLGGTAVSAQDFDTYKRQRQEAFQNYKQKTQQEWEAYRQKINEEYAAFLERPWSPKNSEEPVTEPVREPDVPPVVLPELDVVIPEDNPIPVVDVTIPVLDETPTPIAPIAYKPKPQEKTVSFVFYGTKGRVRFDPGKKVRLSGADERAVSRFWKGLSGEAYDNVVADCQNIRYDRDLCDWAYYKMLEQVAKALYPESNERTVFWAWLLTQSGFSIRLGREGGNIHLLLGTTEALFGMPYWEMKDGRYFLLDGSRVSSMDVMDIQFPGTSALRMRMNSDNRFDKNSAASRQLGSRKYPDAKVTVSCDKNTLAFLNDVPASAIGWSDVTDFMKYADMPFSDPVGHAIGAALADQIVGKSEAEAANILLNFVQTAFEYKTDGEAWGRERAFFPEETLYYPYSDCEDRAILFSVLVRYLMGLETAFVLYPGHLAAAVHFSEEIPGDYFVIDGKRYLVCDPTFINASIGRTMTGMNNKAARVFLWD